jgi:hypothetical protein
MIEGVREVVVNISGIGSSSSVSVLRQVGAASNASTGSTSASSSDVKSDVQLSKPAAMMKKLESLQQSDPAKFKEVMTNISESLASAAESASGESASRLSEMAQKFASAAETGDLSSLKPPAGGHGAGHGPGGPHGPKGAGGPPPPPPGGGEEESSSEGDDSSVTSTSYASQAMAAYKQNTPPLDGVFKSAMDNAFALVDEAASSVAA